MHEQLETLARDIDNRLTRVARDAAAGRAPAETLGKEVDSLRCRLDALETRIHRLPAAEIPALAAKVWALRGPLRNLEIAAEGTKSLEDLARLERRPQEEPTRNPLDGEGMPVNDDCTGALPVVVGETVVGSTVGSTNDGRASCGASLTSPDVWFKLVGTGEWVSIDTFGSGYDTVVSVHGGCPGILANEQVCDDDSFGLGSAVSLFAFSGQELWIRVSGFGGASGPFLLHVGTGGSLSGTVTAAATGDPLNSVVLEVFRSGFFIASTSTLPDGSYSVAALPADGYMVVTRNLDGFLDEIFDDIPCPGGIFSGCFPEDGTPVGVTANGDTPGIDFALRRGGTITGRVTDAVSGDPITGLRVDTESYEYLGGGTDFTDANGEYEIGGLIPGLYFVIAGRSSDFLTELWDDVPCIDEFGDCNFVLGTEILVSADVTVPGIDFALDRLAAVSGTVTDVKTGDPIEGLLVRVTESSVFSGESAVTDSDGTYTVGGLLPGTVFAFTDSVEYFDEVWDDIPCPGGKGFNCTPSNGNPIPVAVNTTTPGIDFALARQGSISGTVTDAETGDPLAFVDVTVFTSTGASAAFTSTDGSGAYSVSGLPPGTYFAATSYTFGFVDELYDDLPCDPFCDPTAGTPIAVALGTDTGGIDFALDRTGAVSGTVTDAASGAGISEAVVRVYRADGAVLETAYVSFDGTYTAPDLPPGTYRVTAEDPAFIDELYDDVACPGGPPVGCDLAAGTPVVVGAGATTPGIDFALTRLGSFSGAVTRASTGDSVGATIQVFDAGGSLIREIYVGSYSDTYTVVGLEAGTYFAVARSWFLADQLYEGLPCEPACDPTTGTPISVVLGVDTEGIDFVLGEAGSISGTVTDTVTGEPVTEVEIYLWRANGALQDWALVAGDGTYTFAGLETGTYFATSESWSGIYLDELYDGLPCSDGFGCDVTEGTPIPVTLGAVTSGIDFTLDRSGAVSGRVTDASTGASLPGIEIEVWDAAGSLVREATTDVAGRYLADHLPLGSLFVTTRNNQGYLDELWDDLPCWHGVPTGCNPTKGTPVTVTVGQTTGDIDFALVLFESGILGTVRDGTTGEPLANIPVDVWSSSGQHRASVLTRGSGAYQVGLTPGTYFVSTDNGLGLVDEIFDGVLCPLGPAFDGLCDPLAGTPVEVGAADSAMPPVATGIDFALGMTLFQDGFESGDLSAWSEVMP